MILTILSLTVSYSFARKVVEKTASISLIGKNYESLDEAKYALLNLAKKAAVNELFGEYIQSFENLQRSSNLLNGKETISDNFIQHVETKSFGFVRLNGDPEYFQGNNLGEISVTIEAYTTKEDIDKFKPKTINHRVVITEPNLSFSEIRELARNRVRKEALIDYNGKLSLLEEKQLLGLFHNVKYLKSGYIEESPAFSIEISGVVYPIELLTMLSRIESKIVIIPNDRDNRRLSKIAIGESWGDEWAITVPGGKADAPGWYNLDNLPKEKFLTPEPSDGFLFLHPVSIKEPAIIEGIFLINDPNTFLTLVVGNCSAGDWRLRVIANENKLGDHSIGGSTGTRGVWQQVEYSLANYYGKTIRIQIHCGGDGWYYEHASIDKIEFIRK